ncbi:E3 ubiquitin-protein ligase TRIM71-like [Mytilus californianus]|uniref:E3 ubiquitin-protein ligase TRIM71-like n=1 Tax=Mytilus californianus TaxID=6549 RepID=UPI002246C3EA|nr:E3 ubiquitin-protein ligase TRIM71-like [Mytilus californianus]XP_052085817.1 E3 ubiquitin-protein ligase TRIM71-like [Mytilus californianus]XP_052085818.1 E3 ubiquitin-protein ligase TRIM71-like [Mytilus californianus]
MASNWTVCGVCDFRNIQKSSVVWCSECDEGLCDECKEHHGAVKSSRNHNVIPVTEYQKLPLNVLKITQTCQKHKEQYQTFCKKHDCPCCRRCVIETHNECKDLTAIDDMVHNIKSSNAFLEIQTQLSEMLENIQTLRNDRRKNLKCLQEQRDKIALDIKQTRKMLNDYLDEIQDNLIEELYNTEENESKKINQLLSTIEKNERQITDLKVNFTNIQQHASDIQAFLALKHIGKEVSDKEEFILSVLKSEEMEIKTLYSVADKEIQNIGKYLGSVGFESNPSSVVITGNKSQQAQMTVPIAISKCIDTIELRNKREMNMASGIIRGCAIIPNGKMMFSYQDHKKVTAFNSNGTYIFEVTMDTSACDIAYIEAENIIAVTSGYSKMSINMINIIDLNSRKMKRSIRVSSCPYGIAVRNDTLVFCEEGKGIQEIQLKNDSKKTLVSHCLPIFSYIAVNGDRLYFTNKDENSLTCCDIRGNLEWKLKDIQDLKYPQGISIDSNGNLYVACVKSHSVVLISNDGKRYRTILTAIDGLSSPRALHIERKSNSLLVANERKYAFLYDIE